MDESWRIPIGSVVPRRRSTGQPRMTSGGSSLDPDDFRDVFGGPPRTVLLRQFSPGDLTSPSSSSPAASYLDRLRRFHQRRPSFYEEVFRRQLPPEPQGTEIGRRLPDFTVPSGGGARRAEEETEGFYDDILFGRRSRTRSQKSKSNSSSVLSSEEQDGGELTGPLRPWHADDGVLSSFASKLRPITIPSRRCDAPSPTSPDEQISSHRTSAISRHRSSHMDLGFQGNIAGAKAVDIFRPYSPEETIIDVELKMPTGPSDDSDSDSDCSIISSIYDIPMATIRPLTRSHGEVAPQEFEKKVVVMLEGEEEADSSYMIEIVPCRKAAEDKGSTALDEAIAWAKERFQASSLHGAEVEARVTDEDA